MNQVTSIKLSELQPAPWNPRDSLGDLTELSNSLKEHGLLNPLIARPFEGKYQVVCGHRRLAAAKKAKLDEVLVSVRELDDKTALEVALVDNLQRLDIHPLSEADGYKELMEKHGHTAEEIAAKCGKSKAYVYGRLKLCELVKAARKPFVDGVLTASVALLIARLPAAQQDEALKIATHQWGDGVPSFRDVQREFEHRFMLELKRAPFELADAQLVPAAGPCTTCPKRTGNNPGLFDDVEDADVCTDATCFQGKVAAAAARKKEEAQSAGCKVFEGKKAEQALGYGSGYVKLDEPCYEDPKHRTWAQVLKREKVEVERAVAIDRQGAAKELVDEKEVRAALKDAGVAWAKARPPATNPYSDQERKRLKAAKLRGQVVEEGLRRIAAEFQDEHVENRLWPLLLELVMEAAGWEILRRVGKAREIETKDQGAMRKALQKSFEKADTGPIQGLILQLLCGDTAAGGSWSPGYGSAFKRVMEYIKVDLKKLEKELKDAAPKKKGGRTTKAPKQLGKEFEEELAEEDEAQDMEDEIEEG